jgi:hypothetical protein
MSILDDAIRQHLELKRAHGADDSELKKLEDEAFGPPQRPDEIDPFSEAPTEFLGSPGEAAAEVPEVGDEGERSGRRPNLTDLQEPPEAEAPGAATEAETPRADIASSSGPDAAPVAPDAAPSDEDAAEMPPPAPTDAALAEVEDELSPPPDAPPPSPADAAGVPLPPPPGEPAADLAPPTGEAAAPPAEEGALFFDQESPSEEAAAAFFDQELVLPGEGPSVPTEEATPPTDEAPAPPDAPTPPTDQAPAPPDAPKPPTDEAPAPPAEEEHPAGEHEVVADAGPGTEEREAIADQPTQMFDVQAHVEAEAAAEAPPTGEQESPTDEELVDAAGEEPQAAPPAPDDAGPPTELYEQPPLESQGPDAEVAGHPPAETEPEEGSAEFDFFNEQRLSDELDQALEAPLPPTDEHLAMPQYKDAPAEEPAAEEPAAEDADEDEDENDYDPETGHEDILEDTPRFLEDAPEDDDLWFEQKPPKDFDLD